MDREAAAGLGWRMALAGEDVTPPHGLAYDPRGNGWSPLPQAPLLGRVDPTAVWTAHSIARLGRLRRRREILRRRSRFQANNSVNRSAPEPMPNAEDDRPCPSRFRPEFGE